jgi:hypothetical protein
LVRRYLLKITIPVDKGEIVVLMTLAVPAAAAAAGQAQGPMALTVLITEVQAPAAVAEMVATIVAVQAVVLVLVIPEISVLEITQVVQLLPTVAVVQVAVVHYAPVHTPVGLGDFLVVVVAVHFPSPIRVAKVVVPEAPVRSISIILCRLRSLPVSALLIFVAQHPAALP